MPELPEVEAVRRSLEGRLVGRRIRGLAVHNRQLRTRLDPAALRRRMVGRRIVRLGRRSKYLLLHLDDDAIVVVHFGMTGRLLLAAESTPVEPHTHVRFALDSGTELRFRDPRRFGMLFVVRNDRLARHPRFARLGPEPFDAVFDVDYLLSRARGMRRPIKNFLMDATVVVGVGNIYANESLHCAAVHPMTPAGRLRRPRWLRVHQAVQRTLQEALQQGGTTLKDFRDGDGRAGEFQPLLAVYGREGQPCARCSRPIRRIVQAGRSSFYCPGCQT